MSELPHDPIDELLHRAHNAADGAPPEFMGRMRARLLAEDVTRRSTRTLYIQIGVAAAAVIILALVVGMNVQWILPRNEPIEQDSAEADQPKNKPTPEPNSPVIMPEPQPEPDDSSEPAPEPQPKPEKPDDTVEKPEPTPEPEPKQPEDTVEKPQPETPDVTPDKPEPKQPDDTVEKPEPKEPDGTEVKPDSPTGRWAQVTVLGEPKLQTKYGDNDWHDYDGGKLLEGASLKAGRGSVDLQLEGGGLARFNGEVHLELEGEAIQFVLVDDSLYIDNLETSKPVVVLGKGHTVKVENGVGIVYAMHQALEAVCLAGVLSIDEAEIPNGFSRRATARGVGDPKQFRGDRFLNDLPERVLLREDFTEAPPGGMYGDGERLEDGVAVQENQPGYIAFRYNPTMTVLPGTVLRMRIRTTGVSKLELELFTDSEIKPLKRNKQQMFKHIWSPDKNGEWIEVELKVEEIPDNEDPKTFPTYGTLLRNFKLHFTGKKLEIDWVEFVRVQD